MNRFASKLPRNRFPSKLPSKRFPGTGSQARFPKNRFPSKVPKRFARGSQEQLLKQGSQRTGSQARFPRGSQEVPKNSFSSKVHKEQVPKQGSDEQVPGNVSKNRCPRKVPSIGNNRILQSLKNCSSNSTERLKNYFCFKKMVRHPRMDKKLDDSVA